VVPALAGCGGCRPPRLCTRPWRCSSSAGVHVSTCCTRCGLCRAGRDVSDRDGSGGGPAVAGMLGDLLLVAYGQYLCSSQSPGGLRHEGGKAPRAMSLLRSPVWGSPPSLVGRGRAGAFRSQPALSVVNSSDLRESWSAPGYFSDLLGLTKACAITGSAVRPCARCMCWSVVCAGLPRCRSEEPCHRFSAPSDRAEPGGPCLRHGARRRPHHPVLCSIVRSLALHDADQKRVRYLAWSSCSPHRGRSPGRPGVDRRSRSAGRSSDCGCRSGDVSVLCGRCRLFAEQP